MDGRAPGLHHRPAVGLLVVADADHEHLALEVEQLAGERQRRAPLAGAGLGGELAHALALVVVGLRDGGVRLVRAGGRDALVLVVDVRGGVERALEAVRAVERRRAPQLVDLAHLLGDLDLGLGRDLLLDQPHREDRRQVVGAERLLGRRVKRRRAARPAGRAAGSPSASGSRDSGSRYLTRLAHRGRDSMRQRFHKITPMASRRHLERLPLGGDPLRLARADRRRACARPGLPVELLAPVTDHARLRRRRRRASSARRRSSSGATTRAPA